MKLPLGVLVCALLAMGGCGPSLFGQTKAQSPATPRRAAPSDGSSAERGPLALLPAGMELVAEIDAAQLGRWPLTRRFHWLGLLLPDESSGRLGALLAGVHPEVQLLALGIGSSGADGRELLLVASGHPGEATAERLLGPGAAPPITRAEYRGIPLLERGGRAYARLHRETAVYGPRLEVRRAVDVLRENEDGFFQAAGDRGLVAALRRAPSAKEGRVALRGALRLGSELRQRLVEAGLSAESVGRIDWISVAVAVGDGADLGVVAGTRDERTALRLMNEVQQALARLKTQPAVRHLGLAPLVDAVQMGRKHGEVHFGFRLEARRLERLLDGIDALLELARGRQE